MIINNKQLQLQTVKNQVFACLKCSMCTTRKHTVFGEGNIYARVMIIGEAPGEEEDSQGRPFVGRAGKLLDQIIKACNWQRTDVYIANILKCRPPKNRLPSTAEIDNCSNFLERQIRLVNPEFILCLGSVASNTLIGLTINEARGKWFSYKHHKVICTYHPAYLLRNQDAKRFVWNDLQLLLKAMCNDKISVENEERNEVAKEDAGGKDIDGQESANGNPEGGMVGHSTAGEHYLEAS
jgi:uracil-DNA glycosylase